MDQLASLRQHLEQNERTRKRAKRFELSKDDISRLLNQGTMPALNKITAELKPYFQIVKTRGFVSRGRILIQEQNTSFLFQIHLDSTYSIDIVATTVFGTFPTCTNCRIFNESIRIEDYELLTEEKIIGLFSNVFTNRHEITERIVREEKELEENIRQNT
ncbi:MAG TPA: hypothetical protein VGO50_02535 [Pyrinomonadaceae bacterium]|jgi:hypothetical protein|nr:hypothetical protein [Pyrinomonadaceae bacterium]